MSGLTCQKCRQPLAAAAMMDDSLAALSPSAYDFISCASPALPKLQTAS